MIVQTNSRAAYTIYFDKIDEVNNIVLHEKRQNIDVLYSYSYSFDNATWSDWFDDKDKIILDLSENPSNLGNIYIRMQVSASRSYDLEFANYTLDCVLVDGTPLSVCDLKFNNANDLLQRTNTKNLYRPYRDTDKAQSLNKILARGISDVFSHECIYFRTEPDFEKRLTTFKTFPLVDVVERSSINVLVDQNKLPDSRYQYSEYDYDFQDEIEIHIVIDVWREIFGNTEPNTNDYLFLPLTNRMYQINTAYDNKKFMHKATYYRAMLVEFEQRADVIEDDDIKAEIDQYVEMVDQFDIDKVEEEAQDAIRAELHEVSEISEDVNIKIADVSYKGTSVVDYMYDWTNTENDIIANSYEVEQFDNEFAVSYWFKFIGDYSSTTKTMVSALDNEGKRLARVYLKNQNEVGFQMEMIPSERFTVKASLSEELEQHKTYGLLVNYAYNTNGEFVTITIVNSDFETIGETVDQNIQKLAKKVELFKLRGGFMFGNIRMKKSFVKKSKMLAELSDKTPRPSKYYVVDNTIPTYKTVSVGLSEDCITTGTPISGPSLTSQEDIIRIIIECTDADGIIEEISTAERDATEFKNNSIIFNTDTESYELYLGGIWNDYGVGKEEVKAVSGW